MSLVEFQGTVRAIVRSLSARTPAGRVVVLWFFGCFSGARQATRLGDAQDRETHSPPPPPPPAGKAKFLAASRFDTNVLPGARHALMQFIYDSALCVACGFAYFLFIPSVCDALMLLALWNSTCPEFVLIAVGACAIVSYFKLALRCQLIYSLSTVMCRRTSG